MTHHFSCSWREKVEKIFSGHFDQIGPQIWAKKGHFGSKFSKKWKFFKKFFFSIWLILSRKKAKKKRWKIFFLTKLVWHFVIFGQKMRILDFKEFWRFQRFLMIMTMFTTSIKFVKLVNMIILRFLRFLGFFLVTGPLDVSSFKFSFYS